MLRRIQSNILRGRITPKIRGPIKGTMSQNSELLTPEQEQLKNNIVNIINLFTYCFYIEVSKFDKLIILFDNTVFAYEKISSENTEENTKSKTSLKAVLETLYRDIQETHIRVFAGMLTLNLIQSCKHCEFIYKLVAPSGGKMTGGNVGHFFIILMWILYGTYFLSTGILNQTSISSQDGNNKVVKVPQDVVGKQLYDEYREFVTEFTTAYNKQIVSQLRGTVSGILPIILKETNETLTINLPPSSNLIDKILADIKSYNATQNIIDYYIPNGESVVSVIEETILLAFVNSAAEKMSTLDIKNIAQIANTAATTTMVVKTAVASNIGTTTVVVPLVTPPILKNLATAYNTFIDGVALVENRIKTDYDNLIQTITLRPKENIAELKKLITNIEKYNKFIEDTKTSHLRGTFHGTVVDLLKKKPVIIHVNALSKNRITDEQIDKFIRGIEDHVLKFAVNVSYEITYASGAIIMNFLKNIIADIIKQQFNSSIGLAALLIPLTIYCYGILKKQPTEIKNPKSDNDTKSNTKSNTNTSTNNTTTTSPTGGRKTKKPKHLKKNKKTQKKNKYSRKLRKNSVIL